MQYAIHEDFYADVKKKLNRVAKKCQKCGNDFTFDFVGTEMREDKKNKCFHKFIIIEVEGTAKVNDWEFIASLDIHNSGNVIRRYNTDIDVPERFLHSENVCEHCGTKRKRNSLYIVHNVVTGEFKQVGGNCLALYTDGLDIEYVAAYMDGITELEDNNGTFFNGTGGKYYYTVEDVLHYANVFTKKIGYLKSNGYDDISTKGLVCEMMRRDVFSGNIGDKVKRVNNILNAHRILKSVSVADFTHDNGEDVNAIIEYYANCDDNNEFIHNVRIMLDNGYVPYNYLGYICYLPCGYYRHVEREIEKAKRLALKHEHWGEVGKRYKNMGVKHIELATQFDTCYGIMRIWNIVLEDDSVVTWKTSNIIEDEVSSVAFTVKEHCEYKGTKQTVVTRCSFK